MKLWRLQRHASADVNAIASSSPCPSSSKLRYLRGTLPSMLFSHVARHVCMRAAADTSPLFVVSCSSTRIHRYVTQSGSSQAGWQAACVDTSVLALCSLLPTSSCSRSLFSGHTLSFLTTPPLQVKFCLYVFFLTHGTSTISLSPSSLSCPCFTASSFALISKFSPVLSVISSGSVWQFFVFLSPGWHEVSLNQSTCFVQSTKSTVLTSVQLAFSCVSCCTHAFPFLFALRYFVCFSPHAALHLRALQACACSMCPSSKGVR